MEYCSCDLCGSSDHVVLWDKTDREKAGVLRSAVIRDKEGNIIQGRNVMCKRCGLVYVSPRFTKPELDRFYAEDYRKIYGGEASLESEKRHAEMAFNLMPKGSHLDIGCSTGQLIKLTGGLGIEPNEQHYEMAVKLCQDAHQGTVYYGTFEDFKPVSVATMFATRYQRFDIITMLNALEHVISPTAVLQKIHSLLNDGGHVLISVPNLLSTHINIPVDAFLSNAHLYNFTAATLGIMMSKCGLLLEKVWLISEEMGQKIYMLAQKGEPVEVEFDDNIEKRIEFTKMFLEYVDRVFVMKQILNGGLK